MNKSPLKDVFVSGEVNRHLPASKVKETVGSKPLGMYTFVLDVSKLTPVISHPFVSQTTLMRHGCFCDSIRDRY